MLTFNFSIAVGTDRTLNGQRDLISLFLNSSRSSRRAKTPFHSVRGTRANLKSSQRLRWMTRSTADALASAQTEIESGRSVESTIHTARS